MSKLIGLTGQAGSGKDYVFGLLSFEFPRTRRIAFADGVREEIEDILKTDVVWDKPYPSEVRSLLQWWGTDLRRAQDKDYWVKYTAKQLRESLRKRDLTIVTDVRFENEAKAIRDLGGIVVEVFAEPIIRQNRLGGTLPSEHASEVIDFETDAVIINNHYPTFPPVVTDYLGLPEGWTPGGVTARVRNLLEAQ